MSKKKNQSESTSTATQEVTEDTKADAEVSSEVLGLSETKDKETTVSLPNKEQAEKTAHSGSMYAQRILSISDSDVMKSFRNAMKQGQHYVMITGPGGKDQATLTRDGWNLLASMFGINISIVEEETKEHYEYPAQYNVLKEAYERSFDKWIAGELPVDAGTKLKNILDRLSDIYDTDIRPTKKLALRVKVRVEFTKLNDKDPTYFREEIGRDMVATSEYRVEYFKLLTRVCNRALRNLIGGLLGNEVVGSDEELNEDTSSNRNPK